MPRSLCWPHQACILRRRTPHRGVRAQLNITIGVTMGPLVGLPSTDKAPSTSRHRGLTLLSSSGVLPTQCRCCRNVLGQLLRKPPRIKRVHDGRVFSGIKSFSHVKGRDVAFSQPAARVVHNRRQHGDVFRTPVVETSLPLVDDIGVPDSVGQNFMQGPGGHRCDANRPEIRRMYGVRLLRN